MNGKSHPFRVGLSRFVGFWVVCLLTWLRYLFVPSLGELSRDLWGPAPTSAGMPGEGVYEVEFKNTRTNVIRLLPNGFQERKLRRLANASAKLFNEVNYERRRQFFQQQRVDFKGTWVKYYGKYKDCLVLMLKP